MEPTKDKLVIDFIKDPNKYFLDNTSNVSINDNPVITIDDVVFVHIKKITFDDEAPRKEAIENVLSTLRFPGVNIVYLIKGNKRRVSFYYGIVRNRVVEQKISYFPIDSVGTAILKRCIEGNFRGSEVEAVGEPEAEDILKILKKSPCVSRICGVPGINSDETSNFQGVDRLIDTMLGDEFAFVVTAMNLMQTPISVIENNVCDFYDKLVPLSKVSRQRSTTVNETSSKGKSTNRSSSHSEETSSQDGRSSEKTTNISRQKGSNGTESGGENTSKQHSSTHGISDQTSTGTSENVSKSNGMSDCKTFSFEEGRKQAQDWMAYADETLLPRLDYGKGKGLFIVCMTLFTNDFLTLRKLENTVTSLFSGEKGNKVPLAVSRVRHGEKLESDLRNLQIPIGCFKSQISAAEILMRSSLAQYVTKERGYLGNWMSVKELGIIAGLPRKEVVGLNLCEEIDFGLNYDDSNIPKEDKLQIGSLVHSGIVNDNIKVSLSKEALNKHIFVCGVTGCGKTTTCMGLLKKSKMPFLVIEPAKTEYRILTNGDSDVLVFTLGRDDVAPFRFNPLEFLPNETISSHVDMVKASIEAAFEMEAAIPQIIEAALYKSYQDYGWDILSSKNSIYDDPFRDGVYAFPTLSDLIRNTEIVVEEQGFDVRLKNDYIGSIKARLQGLIIGSKGAMLNTPRSIDFTDLVHKKVILELEEIKSGTEKSLIMGFVLSTLCEAIKYEFSKDKDFRHITLVEEAHRLLSKYIPGDSLSKKNGVETFSDMLAEVRKYGEGLIIADQIPQKMAPDVLKNTNTKIVHKIFAQDDKEAIGNTMALTDEQKSYLSTLVPGRAVVFSQGWEKSILVQIDQEKDTTGEYADIKRIKNLSLNYYVNNYKRGVFPELMCCKQMPSISKLSQIIDNQNKYKSLRFSFIKMIVKRNDTEDFCAAYEVIKDDFTIEEITKYLTFCCLNRPRQDDEVLVKQLIRDVVENKKNLKDPDLRVRFEPIFKPNKIKKL